MAISQAVRTFVFERAKKRCEYCKNPRFVLIYMDVDHIIHKSLDGSDEPDNLRLACKGCNEYKAAFQTGIDPVTEREYPLFNPRTQLWSEHFQWSEDGTYIIGLTPVGRATVTRLKMNHEDIVEARRVWVSAGLHLRSD